MLSKFDNDDRSREIDELTDANAQLTSLVEELKAKLQTRAKKTSLDPQGESAEI